MHFCAVTQDFPGWEVGLHVKYSGALVVPGIMLLSKILRF